MLIADLDITEGVRKRYTFRRTTEGFVIETYDMSYIKWPEDGVGL